MKKYLDTPWSILGLITVMSTYFYTFMEWVFFVTKPSFMSTMSIVSKGMVLLASSMVFMLCCIVIGVLFLALDIFLKRGDVITQVPFYLATFLPALVLATLALILLDNFTYTIFKFGVATIPSWTRGAYAVGYLITVYYFFRWILKQTKMRSKEPNRPMLTSMGVLIVLSLLSAAVQFRLPSKLNLQVSRQDLPNILIIGSDGVNADNMSVYGYERKTSPYLSRLSPEFLIAENAFTNADNTFSSTTSLLAGKLPTDTGVISSSNILTGEDAYQHLPGILRSLGYYGVQFGVPSFVDAYTVNMQYGFDMVNGRTYDNYPIFRLIRNAGLSDVSYFLATMYERAESRILHIFYIRNMENPINAVTEDESAGMTDKEKVNQIVNLIQKTQTPLFVHAHLMGTHGATFESNNDKFSKGEAQDEGWMIDFYDDAILDFDGYIRRIVNALDKSGKLDRTILVIYTDHNMKYLTNQRIPLMIRFPNGEWAGRVENDVQNMDIAPTILDYLGIEKPVWMSGQSFLHNEPPADRLIISGDNLNTMRVIQCDRWYAVSLLYENWRTGEVENHTAPCTPLDIKNKSDIPQTVLSYFVQSGKADIGEMAKFSPDSTREQASVDLMKRKYGSGHIFPTAEGIFADVSASAPNAGAIEQAYRDGIMEPCSFSPLAFCPEKKVTRAEAAMSILKILEGNDYHPPAAHGVFADVPASSPFAPWVEELYARGMTKGCKVNPLSYCPSNTLLNEILDVYH